MAQLDVLAHAWRLSRANHGEPGVDGIENVERIERDGLGTRLSSMPDSAKHSTRKRYCA